MYLTKAKLYVYSVIDKKKVVSVCACAHAELDPFNICKEIYIKENEEKNCLFNEQTKGCVTTINKTFTKMVFFTQTIKQSEQRHHSTTVLIFKNWISLVIAAAGAAVIIIILKINLFKNSTRKTLTKMFAWRIKDCAKCKLDAWQMKNSKKSNH